MPVPLLRSSLFGFETLDRYDCIERCTLDVEVTDPLPDWFQLSIRIRCGHFEPVFPQSFSDGARRRNGDLFLVIQFLELRDDLTDPRKDLFRGGGVEPQLRQHTV